MTTNPSLQRDELGAFSGEAFATKPDHVAAVWEEAALHESIYQGHPRTVGLKNW